MKVGDSWQHSVGILYEGRYLRGCSIERTPGTDTAEQQNQDGERDQGGQQDEQPEENLILRLVLRLHGSEKLLTQSRREFSIFPLI